MPRFSVPGRRSSGAPKAAQTTAKEAFRVLRSNLLVSLLGIEHPVVVVTSAFAGEGKTSTSVSLAQSLAATGSRVALVDFDLRSPDAHRLLGAHNEAGVSDVLLEWRMLDDCVQHVSVDSTGMSYPVPLRFLAAGPRVTSPTELLATQRTGQLLEELAALSDIVLIDTPPVLPVADTLIAGRLATGAMLVLETRRTSIPAARRAKDALTRNQTRILGVVLNKFTPEYVGDNYGYGYETRPIAPDGFPMERHAGNGSSHGRAHI